MAFRHEWKIEITEADHIALRGRLRYIMRVDPHASGGTYRIRSMYFDTPLDRALHEKIDGEDRREKFRIRCYDGDTDFLRLEKKAKQNGLCSKMSAMVTAEEVNSLLSGGPDALEWMRRSQDGLVRELYCKMKTEMLAPKTVVEYTREPFVFYPGNVRVTFDYGLRTGSAAGFLDADPVTIPAPSPAVLMEVKWDAFLPDSIRLAIQMPGRRAAAFSKYAQCRVYG